MAVNKELQEEIEFLRKMVNDLTKEVVHLRREKTYTYTPGIGQSVLNTYPNISPSYIWSINNTSDTPMPTDYTIGLTSTPPSLGQI